ncbi:MAG: DUF6377 domain-containing protein [Paludibacteraceae bacterium]
MLTLFISILLQLDNVIANRQDYINAHEQDILTTKNYYHMAEGATRYHLAQQLWQQYNGFNNDSALIYAREAYQLAQDDMQRQHANIHIANSLAVSGNYTAALDILRTIKPDEYPEIANEYYKTLNLTYIWQAEFSTIAEEQAQAREHIVPLRYLTIRYETDSLWIKQEQALLLLSDSPQEALQLLLPAYRQLKPDNPYIRYFANTIGSCYQHLYWQYADPAMQDSALFYYATSAIADMQQGVLEHASLREVALILYQRGDIERAYQYMNCCIQDAEQSSARLRTVEMANDMPLILSAYRTQLTQQQRQLKILIYALIAVTAVLAVVLIVLVILLRRYRRINSTAQQRNQQLSALNAQLSNLNQQLTISNRIRDTYVTRYMTECSDIIETMTQYQKTLRRAALSDNPKQLLNLVKSNDIIDKTLHEFYQHFDESFLSLFPTFIDDLNTTLPPDEQFNTRANIPGTAPRLTTELRVYALIKLGITHSEDIARFLRISVKTVYNYRTQIRNHTLLQISSN